MMEKTLIIVKPDGVQRGLVGKVIQRIENVGFKVIGLKMITVTMSQAEEQETGISGCISSYFVLSKSAGGRIVV